MCFEMDVNALGLPENVVGILSRFVDGAREILEANLLGVYLHGSASMGCFNPKLSDLDLLVGVRESPPDFTKRCFMDMILSLHEDFCRGSGRLKGHSGIEMSVVLQKDCKPFAFPTPFDLHFSAMHENWYRENPADYVQKMKGCDVDLAAHFMITKKRGVCLYGMKIDDFFADVPPENYLESIMDDVCGAEEEISGNTCYLVLNLSRVLAFKKEGLVLSKREGGEWALKNLPPDFAPLLESALEEYRGDSFSGYDLSLAKRYAVFALGEIKKDD
ncbi:MAG: DUF4111 domain-containing protein [Treponema sp.]|nr:DUF4111 domain-containing protein [Treponema sp.]